MNIRLERTSRKPTWPLWAAGVVAAWAALVGGAGAAWRLAGWELNLCLFKQLTGLPCATCGSGRALLSLAGGNIAGAWAYNPLMLSVAAAAGTLVLLRLLFARRVRVGLSRGEKVAAWCLAGAVVLGNWAYLLLRGF